MVVIKATPTFKPKYYAFIALAILAILILAYFIYRTLNTKKPPVETPPQNRIIVAPSETSPANFNPKLQKGPYSCPLPKTFCKNSAYEEGSMSAKLSATTIVLASFDGEFQPSQTSKLIPGSKNRYEDITTGVLSNTERGLRAYYYLHGTTITQGQVKAGQTIATSSAKPLQSFLGNSFVFELLKLNANGSWTKTNLKPEDFINK